ncbi:NUDIX hydrolase [Priestia sp. Y58]|uniref:NUDIX hydrolase n=1 Tax=Priestia TaxID=2800373 RepID=UPI00221F0B24|nr:MULTISPECIES: NUDIX hydrolase [Priestia]MCZ8493025.1 NUDIX hydrolase [Priestia megaterium]MDG0031265.1 NUDIX hydrolase [Priestia sp. Y58]MDG0060518.1 NUDIX hydrolase [Priestia sp. P5]UYV53782.1 NUDIX hydrolase [Priestia megaterium]
MNQKLAVAVMVVNQDHHVLLVKNHRRGWEFPGGFVEAGESIKDAGIREVKEESGIVIEVTNFLGVEQDVKRSTTVILLKGKAISGKISVSNETQDVGYFTLEEAKNIIKLDNFKDRMARCLKETETPFFYVLKDTGSFYV